jgi:hypothetical protein
MTLYQQLEAKVSEGSTSWIEVLSEIHRIRKQQNHLPEIPQTVALSEREPVLFESSSHYPDPLKLYIRKEMYEHLPSCAKEMVETILELDNSTNLLYNKVRIRKMCKEKGMKRQSRRLAERVLMVYTRELGIYE